MDPETADRDDEIKWNLLQTDLGVPEADETPSPGEASTTVALPVEPAPAQSSDDPAAAVAVRNELFTFFYYGHRESDADGPAPVPALLYQHRDLSTVRHEYPICLIPTGPGAPGRTLAQIFDDLIEAESDDESDAGRRFAQHARRLEYAVRSLAAGVKKPGRLSDLCSKAAEQLVETPGLSAERKDNLEDDLAKAQKLLPVDGDVITCSTAAPQQLFQAAMAAFWGERAGEYRSRLDKLIRDTQDILESADSRSAGALSPEQLAEASAEEDGLDYDAMSDILGESRLAEPLPEERRKRIETALETMRRILPLYATAAGDPSEELPFSMETVVNDCPAAERQHRERMAVMADFFKNVRIARLEVENKYHAETHGPFFTHFDPSELTDEEMSYCPPVLMYLDSGFIKKARKIELLNLLAGGTPVKVLVELGDLCHSDGDGNAGALPSWMSHIASMVSAMGNVYVSQATASRPSLIQKSMVEGFHYNGPALFSVYCPASTHDPALDTYLVAAAAEEARTFPSFTYDPGKGDTLADRMNILENPAKERVWPVDTFVYQTQSEEQRRLELPFTPADFLLADTRLDHLFWNVPPSKWIVEMVPLHEYLAEDESHTDGGEPPERLPYLTAVDERGRVARVVPTRQVLTAVQRAAQAWRGLQEMGGIDNSHALALIAEEKQQLEEDKQREVEAIEQKYSTELERDLGDLSQEIIRRIAGQLIAQGQAAPSFAPFAAPKAGAAPAAAAPPAAEAAPAAAEAKVEEEEEEEAVSFDDPYIDTPLCTSCNDCMKFNAQVFLYNENKQAYIGDVSKATYEQLVLAAEKCPVHIIHPGKPKNPNEPNLDELVKRAAKFN
jgi:ferredoxin